MQQDEKLRGDGTISYESLKLLYPADVTRVIWGKHTWAIDPALRPACTVD